jgi:formamidopyrimidine-DNA glycosylase
MPELPEVETVVRGLRRTVIGARLGRVRLASSRINAVNQYGWRAALKGCRIEAVGRRGKYILVNLSGQHTLVVHLRMTGRLWVRTEPYRRQPHDRFIVSLGVRRCLVLNDARQFARVHWCAPGTLAQHSGLAKLGPDALTITVEQLRYRLATSQRPIKSLLLDQTQLAGLGNIYADESLFLARIRPTTSAAKIGPKRTARLHHAIGDILRRAIEACGTTMDTFSDIEGGGGGFGPSLMVYRRTGEACRICGSVIQRVVLAGRSTHFCRHCQRR